MLRLCAFIIDNMMEPIVTALGPLVFLTGAIESNQNMHSQR